MKLTSILILALLSIGATSALPGEVAAKRGAGSAPLLSSEGARNAGLGAKEIGEARKLYTTKCMRCHKSYEPAGYSQPQWETWMSKMRKKARLSSEQDALLHRYLQAYRSTCAIAGLGEEPTIPADYADAPPAPK